MVTSINILKLPRHAARALSPGVMLIALNFLIFVIIRIAAIWHDAETIVDMFAINTADSLVQVPWTIATYTVVHVDFLHLLFNMGVLLAACMVTDMTGNINNLWIYPIYATGAIAGGLAFRIVAPEGAVLIGASCGVMAIVGLLVIVLTCHNRQFPLFGTVKLSLPTLILVLLHLCFIMPVNQAVGVAHASGFAIGCLVGIRIIKRCRKANRNNHPNFSEIERINNKARNSGYSSLTSEEREIIENNTRN